ncbi:MAG: tRNA threonylcarbamoyladenosine dehydratase [Methyloversatilis sp.]|jgi:tRNA A37 threonylcarbamoyladenosine dehydratase|nr:tRNA threonylcarbamoyladenosine dehydratase [Methyloversatilis sp.]MBP6193509.1 tRNA threonylcarbamoyladenosine dehydratase [Methyloversatilis sp.]MBP9116807.1 tRNA threonylcarbamoyladenosine dehydratase [Methyloversatilis sp.]
MANSNPSAITPRKFSAINRLLGNNAYQILAQSSVLIVGIGGVGSWAAEAAARSAIGRITLADLDHVAESNINRQIQALDSTVGMAKTEAMKLRIADINALCEVTCIEDFLSAENVSDLLAVRFDAVIDCTDQVSAKVAMALHCAERRIPLFMAGAAGGRADPTRVRHADLGATQGDALLARVRSLLRKSGKFVIQDKAAFGVGAVFSTEPMRRPGQEACAADASFQGLSCTGYGSSVCVTAAFGFALAAAAIDHLLNKQ